MHDLLLRILAIVRQTHRNQIVAQHGTLFPGHTLETELDSLHNQIMSEDDGSGSSSDVVRRLEAIEKKLGMSGDQQPEGQEHSDDDQVSDQNEMAKGEGTPEAMVGSVEDKGEPSVGQQPGPDMSNAPQSAEEESRHQSAVIEEVERHAEAQSEPKPFNPALSNL